MKIKKLHPSEYLAIKRKNDLKIRELQNETERAHFLAVRCPRPKMSSLRPATLDDLKEDQVFWFRSTHCLGFGPDVNWVGAIIIGNFDYSLDGIPNNFIGNCGCQYTIDSHCGLMVEKE